MSVGRGELQVVVLPFFTPTPTYSFRSYPRTWLLRGGFWAAWRYRFSGLWVALVLLSWRRPPDPAHRIWGSACSVAAAPWSAGLGRRQAGGTGRAVLRCCARTPAPGKYRCYRLGSSGRLQPVGQAALLALNPQGTLKNKEIMMLLFPPNYSA